MWCFRTRQEQNAFVENNAESGPPAHQEVRPPKELPLRCKNKRRLVRLGGRGSRRAAGVEKSVGFVGRFLTRELLQHKHKSLIAR